MEERKEADLRGEVRLLLRLRKKVVVSAAAAATSAVERRAYFTLRLYPYLAVSLFFSPARHSLSPYFLYLW